ncbi:hypothetical protein [Halomicrococcus gelatinilyticus]|uniref:hypothetical protein n=1 Tax=Halomicrococcus gelatinilyticus TaxID=1702103 RepID=UPI002E0E38A8
MRRRRLLGSLSALVTVGLLGAVLPFGSESNATELRDLTVSNHDDEPHVVHLQVEHDGDLVHWQSYDVEAKHTVFGDESAYDVVGGADVPCAWPAEPGRIVLRARVDDRSEWETYDLGESDADCRVVEAHVGRDGRFTFMVSGDCASRADEPTACGADATTE